VRKSSATHAAGFSLYRDRLASPLWGTASVAAADDPAWRPLTANMRKGPLLRARKGARPRRRTPAAAPARLGRRPPPRRRGAWRRRRRRRARNPLIFPLSRCVLKLTFQTCLALVLRSYRPLSRRARLRVSARAPLTPLSPPRYALRRALSCRSPRPPRTGRLSSLTLALNFFARHMAFYKLFALLALCSGQTMSPTPSPTPTTSPFPTPSTTAIAYTGAYAFFTVPATTTSLYVQLSGAGGGGGNDGRGGAGAWVTGYLDVTPGEILRLIVGKAGFQFTGPWATRNSLNNTDAMGGGGLGGVRLAGGTGTNSAGGDGGGRTAVQRPISGVYTDLVVAGGGGGGGGFTRAGGIATWSGVSGSGAGGTSGTGGTQVSGGIGCGTGTCSFPGRQGFGGNASLPSSDGCGGGGGGFFGGGAGSNSAGGAGSSLISFLNCATGTNGGGGFGGLARAAGGEGNITITTNLWCAQSGTSSSRSPSVAATPSPSVTPPCSAPPGYYCSLGSHVFCPSGSFTSVAGSTSCQQCPGGHFCPPGTSSWARLNCGRGNYCPDGSGAPTPCPYQVPPTGGWGALQAQGPAFLLETAHCLNHCFWNSTSGNGMLSKC
jgi:hypothetical protein